MAIEKSTRLASLELMQPDEHYCSIFRSDEQHRRIAIEFVRLGIERNEKVLYLVNLMTAAELKSMLSTGGINVEAIIEKGQLVIATAKESYLHDGKFQPDKMIDALRKSTAAALDAGYSALRLTGEMSWALAGNEGSERLLEYEAKLNQFCDVHPKASALCQYDQRRFDSDLLIDVLHTHPKVLIGTDGFDNSGMYYVPPDAFLAHNRKNAILDAWLSNLSRRPSPPHGSR